MCCHYGANIGLAEVSLAMDRRSLLLSLSLLPIIQVRAQDSRSDPSDIPSEAPLELNRADFAQAWELTAGDETQLIAGDQDIPDGYSEKFSNVGFGGVKDIDQFFQNRKSDHFINYFNSQIANRLFWAGKKIQGPNVKENFDIYWNAITKEGEVSLFQFICYMSVFINEIDGNLVSRSETFGSKAHPGISYLYNTVAMTSPTGRKWRKKSYNGAPNRTMHSLLNDANFLDGREKLAFYDALKFTTDDAWASDAYPQTFPTSGSRSSLGIILEGDFYKFRGRGLIQTTWRSNYAPLVEFIQSHQNASPVIARFAARWKGLSPDIVCTRSTADDWDELFADPGRVLLIQAVRAHARAGKYLPLSPNSAEANGASSGSVRAMGDRIGGRGYGGNLKARVRQICMAIGEL